MHCADLSNDGLVYVCDRPNDRIQVFSAAGALLRTLRTPKPVELRIRPDVPCLLKGDPGRLRQIGQLVDPPPCEGGAARRIEAADAAAVALDDRARDPQAEPHPALLGLLAGTHITLALVLAVCIPATLLGVLAGVADAPVPAWVGEVDLVLASGETTALAIEQAFSRTTLQAVLACAKPTSCGRLCSGSVNAMPARPAPTTARSQGSFETRFPSPGSR